MISHFNFHSILMFDTTIAFKDDISQDVDDVGDALFKNINICDDEDSELESESQSESESDIEVGVDQEYHCLLWRHV